MTMVFKNSVGLYYFASIVGVRGGHAIWRYSITIHIIIAIIMVIAVIVMCLPVMIKRYILRAVAYLGR